MRRQSIGLNPSVASVARTSMMSKFHSRSISNASVTSEVGPNDGVPVHNMWGKQPPTEGSRNKAVQAMVSPPIRSKAASKERAEFIEAMVAYLRNLSPENAERLCKAARKMLFKSVANDSKIVETMERTGKDKIAMRNLVNKLEESNIDVSPLAWKRVRDALLNEAHYTRLSWMSDASGYDKYKLSIASKPPSEPESLPTVDENSSHVIEGYTHAQKNKAREENNSHTQTSHPPDNETDSSDSEGSKASKNWGSKNGRTKHENDDEERERGWGSVSDLGYGGSESKFDKKGKERSDRRSADKDVWSEASEQDVCVIWDDEEDTDGSEECVLNRLVEDLTEVLNDKSTHRVFCQEEEEEDEDEENRLCEVEAEPGKSEKPFFTTSENESESLTPDEAEDIFRKEFSTADLHSIRSLIKCNEETGVESHKIQVLYDDEGTEIRSAEYDVKGVLLRTLEVDKERLLIRSAVFNRQGGEIKATTYSKSGTKLKCIEYDDEGNETNYQEYDDESRKKEGIVNAMRKFGRLAPDGSDISVLGSRSKRKVSSRKAKRHELNVMGSDEQFATTRVHSTVSVNRDLSQRESHMSNKLPTSASVIKQEKSQWRKRENSIIPSSSKADQDPDFVLDLEDSAGSSNESLSFQDEVAQMAARRWKRKAPALMEKTKRKLGGDKQTPEKRTNMSFELDDVQPFDASMFKNIAALKEVPPTVSPELIKTPSPSSQTTVPIKNISVEDTVSVKVASSVEIKEMDTKEILEKPSEGIRYSAAVDIMMAATLPSYKKESLSDQESAKRYLATHGIYDLFQFMLTKLVSQRPQEPIDYLIGMTRTISRNLKIRRQVTSSMILTGDS